MFPYVVDRKGDDAALIVWIGLLEQHASPSPPRRGGCRVFREQVTQL